MNQGYSVSSSELRHPHEIPAMVAAFAGLGVLVYLIRLKPIGWAIIVGALLLAAVLRYFTSLSKVIGAIHVTPQQFPHIYQAGQIAAARLDMVMPRIYIEESEHLRTTVSEIGRKEGVVTLTTALVEELNPDEVQFMLARAFGQIKCKHSLLQMLHNETSGGFLGLVMQFYQMGLKAVFFWWSRTTVLTADRAGLIGGQDIRAALFAMIKEMVGPQLFHRMNTEALLAQMEQLNQDTVAKVSELVGLSREPYALNRMRALLQYYKSPQYQAIAARQGKVGTTMLQVGDGVATGHLFQTVVAQVQGQAPALVPPADAAAQAQAACRSCGQALKAGARFCAHCGAQQS